MNKGQLNGSNATVKKQLIAIIGLIVFGAVACTETSANEVPVVPSKTEAVEGSELKRVTLSEQAGARLAIVTSEVTEEPFGLRGEPGPRKMVPYSALIYDLNGKAWVYANPSGLTYMREPVVIDYVQFEKAVLHEGPAVGTKIVTTGAAELYGAETGVK